MFHALAEDGWSICKNGEGKHEYGNQQACPFCWSDDMDSGKLQSAGKIILPSIKERRKRTPETPNFQESLFLSNENVETGYTNHLGWI